MKHFSIALVCALVLSLAVPSVAYAEDEYISVDNPLFDQIIEKYLAVNYAISDEFDNIKDTVTDTLKNTADIADTAIKKVVSNTLEGIKTSYEITIGTIGLIKSAIDNYSFSSGSPAPSGFYPVDGSCAIKKTYSGSTTYTYIGLDKDGNHAGSSNVYFTFVKYQNAPCPIYVSMNSLGINTLTAYVRNVAPSPTRPTQSINTLNRAYTINGLTYYYSFAYMPTIADNTSLWVSPYSGSVTSSYSSVDAALSAFYGYVPEPSINVYENPNPSNLLSGNDLGINWSTVNNNNYYSIDNGQDITNVFNNTYNTYNNPNNAPVDYNPNSVYSAVNDDLNDIVQTGFQNIGFDLHNMGFITACFHVLPFNIQNLILLTLTLIMISVVTGLGAFVVNKTLHHNEAMNRLHTPFKWSQNIRRR